MERADTLTKERLLTIRWNNLLALGLRIPALAPAFSAQCGPSTLMMSQPGPDHEWVKRASGEGAGVWLVEVGWVDGGVGVSGVGLAVFVAVVSSAEGGEVGC